MMTKPLSWERWRKVYLNKKNKKRASLERWGLRNLHSVEALDHIVSEVKTTYLNNNPYIKVSANSVWVDGTPQAKFTVSKYENVKNSSTSYGNTNQVSLKARKDEVLNCELADLLFIFNEFNSQNGFKKSVPFYYRASAQKKTIYCPMDLQQKKKGSYLNRLTGKNC